MSGLFKQYKTDESKQANGVRCVVGVNEDKTEIAFIIGRMGKTNPAYAKALTDAMKPHQNAIRLKILDEQIAEDALRQAFVIGCIKGWENVRTEDGRVLEFSHKAANDLMVELPDLYEDLQTKANDISLFRVEEMEQAAKN